MKKLWIAAFFVVWCSPIYFNASWAQEASGPKIVVKDPSFVVEPVNEGKPFEHTFTVLNTGDMPLEINNVKPG